MNKLSEIQNMDNAYTLCEGFLSDRQSRLLAGLLDKDGSRENRRILYYHLAHIIAGDESSHALSKGKHLQLRGSDDETLIVMTLIHIILKAAGKELSLVGRVFLNRSLFQSGVNAHDLPLTDKILSQLSQNEISEIKTLLDKAKNTGSDHFIICCNQPFEHGEYLMLDVKSQTGQDLKSNDKIKESFLKGN